MITPNIAFRRGFHLRGGQAICLQHYLTVSSSAHQVFINRITSRLSSYYENCYSSNERFINYHLSSISPLRSYLFTTNRDRDTENGSKSGTEKKEAEPEIPWGPLLVSAALLSYLLMLVSDDSKNDENLTLISWNEFFYNMLAKGEVARLRIRPELNMVIVELHPNAVIKGRPSSYVNYHLNVPDTSAFERKLRDAEQSLGIRPEDAVPVIYERFYGGLGVIPLLLLIAGIIALVASQRIKFTYNMPNFFVS